MCSCCCGNTTSEECGPKQDSRDEHKSTNHPWKKRRWWFCFFTLASCELCGRAFSEYHSRAFLAPWIIRGWYVECCIVGWWWYWCSRWWCIKRWQLEEAYSCCSGWQVRMVRPTSFENLLTVGHPSAAYKRDWKLNIWSSISLQSLSIHPSLPRTSGGEACVPCRKVDYQKNPLSYGTAAGWAPIAICMPWVQPGREKWNETRSRMAITPLHNNWLNYLH